MSEHVWYDIEFFVEPRTHPAWEGWHAMGLRLGTRAMAVAQIKEFLSERKFRFRISKTVVSREEEFGL